MTSEVDNLMDGLYMDGETTVTKEKVNILRVFLQRAFPGIGRKTVSDASALLAVYCCLVTEGKRVAVGGKDLDADGFAKFIESYGKKTESEFDSLESMYDFYGSALVVALFVYRYTSGFTNAENIFRKTRAGDTFDRISDAIDGDDIR